MPEPAPGPKPTVKMTKTQPLTTAPEKKLPNATVTVASAPATTAITSRTSVSEIVDLLDQVPMPVCWIIFGISSVTLLIQIWNYLSA